MAYIEPGKIADKHIRRLVDNDPSLVADCLIQSDRKVRALARNRGVRSSEIPVDENDFTTSETLYVYGEFWFCVYMCLAVRGSVNTDDVYKVKAEEYRKLAEQAKKEVTLETIIENEITDHAERSAPIVSYG